jgi:hypothetical protein
MSQERYRYPGVNPFKPTEENIFFGRDPDIEQLYELILLEKLVTLFGKSGYGKSSLLNAGILPRFEAARKDSTEYFLPLQIRFGAYVPGKLAVAPVEQVKQRLAEALEPAAAMAFVDNLSASPSLWQEFKKRQSPEHPRFLLIFDQFEELFTYPPEQQTAFKKQLAELLYVAIPQNIRDKAEELPDEDYDRLVRRLEVKTVFAIRSDQLSLLDQLKDALPAILRIRYELKPLQAEQARMAIVQPAALPSTDGHPFSTAPFAYTPGAVDTVIANLAESQQGNQGGIESFLLQMICREIEYAVHNGQVKQRNEADQALVTEAELPDISNIYDQYYKRNLSTLPADQQEAARRVIEEGLLLVKEDSDEEARRLSVDGGALIDRYRAQGVNEALLDALVNAFLLRRERNSIGGFNYEICHDTLIKPIAQSRQERRAEEERLDNERKRQEAEARALEEAKKRQEAERLQQEAERGRRRAVLFSYLALALLVIALLAVFWAMQQSRIAEDRLQAVLEAKAGEDFQKFEKLLQRAEDLEVLYPDAACTLYVQADSLYQLHNNTEIFEGQASNIQQKLQDCK